jgi:hypothetical protein
MPPRRRAAAPIPIDVEAVRRKLAEGKIVRVGISRSAQFPEGGTGRVRQVGNPEIDGEEYVQVELSLNGTRDILPFTPADLTPASRAKPPAEPAVAQPPARAKPSRTTATGSPAPTEATVPPVTLAPPFVPSDAAPAQSTPPVSTATRASTDVSVTNRDVTNRDVTNRDVTNRDVTKRDVTKRDVTSGPVTNRAADDRAAGNRAKNPRGPRRSPPVSITIATTDAEPTQWRIEARVGARVVLRHGSVSPARVWELVQQLEEPTLITAVGGILDEQRKAAQARADALAAELAKVQAELEALPRKQ